MSPVCLRIEEIQNWHTLLSEQPAVVSYETKTKRWILKLNPLVSELARNTYLLPLLLPTRQHLHCFLSYPQPQLFVLRDNGQWLEPQWAGI